MQKTLTFLMWYLSFLIPRLASVETVTTATRTTSKPKGTSKSEDLFDSLFDSFEIEEDVTGGDLYG